MVQKDRADHEPCLAFRKLHSGFGGGGWGTRRFLTPRPHERYEQARKCDPHQPECGCTGSGPGPSGTDQKAQADALQGFDIPVSRRTLSNFMK
jgi:hypothetical protein